MCSLIKNLCLSLGSVQDSVCDQHNWPLGKNRERGREVGEALEIITEKICRMMHINPFLLFFNTLLQSK